MDSGSGSGLGLGARGNRLRSEVSWGFQILPENVVI